MADQHRPAPPSFSANQMHPANVRPILWSRRSRAQHWLNVSCFRVVYLIGPPQYYWLANVGTMLAHHLRRCPIIKPTYIRLLFAGTKEQQFISYTM